MFFMALNPMMLGAKKVQVHYCCILKYHPIYMVVI